MDFGEWGGRKGAQPGIRAWQWGPSGPMLDLAKCLRYLKSEEEGEEFVSHCLRAGL